MLNPLKKNNLRKYFFVTLILISIPSRIIAQDKSWSLALRAHPINSNYFWLEKNNFGRKVSDFNFDSHLEFKKSRITYMVNIFSDTSHNKIENIYLNESFIKYELSSETFLRAGKYYRDFSKYLNDELSSGSMLISHNAQAMPKIGLMTSKNIKKNKRVTFNFGIAHGLFEKNDTYTKAPFLHEKFIYIDIKKNDYEFGIGIVHEAIWAGEIVNLGNQPHKFKDFLKVFISADGPQLSGEPHANALGNHLGIWDFYYKKKNQGKLLKVYYQHFFEDTSGLRFDNGPDGLWGLELSNYLNNTNILFEYLNTMNQDRNPPYVNEAYYNHYQYKEGWSYKGYTLGNPFINHLAVKPVEVFHLGLNGKVLSNYFYRFKAARKINISDKVKYELVITKKFDKKNQTSISDLNIYIMNNDNMKNGLGISISYKL
jgi:hypothetical protein